MLYKTILGVLSLKTVQFADGALWQFHNRIFLYTCILAEYFFNDQLN